MHAEIERRLSSWVPAGVILACVEPIADPALLHPCELEIIARAVPRRRQEFAAGRLTAHALLARLGVQTQPIVVDRHRAPVWPAGIAGTVTHDERHCIVAVARREDVSRLGVDIEPAGDLQRELWDDLLVDSERVWLGAQPKATADRLAQLMFCAKEALYKAQYPLTNALLDFQDVSIALEPATASDEWHVDARFERDVPGIAKGTTWRGRAMSGAHALVAFALR